MVLYLEQFQHHVLQVLTKYFWYAVYAVLLWPTRLTQMQFICEIM